MRKRFPGIMLACVFALCANGTAFAQSDTSTESSSTQGQDKRTELEVALSNENLRLEVIRDTGLFGMDGNRTSLGVLVTTDRDIVVDGAFMVPVTAVRVLQGLTIAIGGRGYGAFLSDPDDDVFALAAGVEARYSLGEDFPLGIYGSIFYAPDITTFGNADNAIDFEFGADYPFTRSLTGFVDFRRLSFDRTAGGDDDIDSNLHIGLRFLF